MIKNKSVTALVTLLAALFTYSSSNASMPSVKTTIEKSNIQLVHDYYRRHRHDDFDDGPLSRKTVDQIKLKLKKRGYKKVVIVDNESPIYILKACRDGVKYRFAVRDDGAVKNRRNIGYCSGKNRRRADDYGDDYRKGYSDRRKRYNDYGVSRSEIIRILNRRGYARVYFTDRVPPVYHLNACKGGVRYRVHVRDNGTIQRNQRIGYCSTGSRYRDYWRSPRQFR